MNLKGKRIAILVADGFEQSEYEVPKRALEEAGGTTKTVSLKAGEVRSWCDQDWGTAVKADLSIDATKADDFDALLLPGGVISPDKLRQDDNVIKFVRSFFISGKPIAAICHGPWTLINAGVIKGQRLTSYKSIKIDLENAGAIWSDDSVVVDNGLITSRCPDDLPDFCEKLIEEVAEGVHPRKLAASAENNATHN